MTLAELERALRTLAQDDPWPRTPDLAAAVAGRLPAARAPRRRARPRALRAAVAVLLSVTVVGAAVPGVPAAVDRRLGVLAGERVLRGERIGPGLALRLGAPTTLADAGRRAHLRPLLPGVLGRPDRVWFGGELAGRAVSLGYGADTVITEIPRASVVIAIKMIGPDVKVRRVRIHGRAALWIDHGPQTLVLPGAHGITERRSALPGAHVLLWDRAGIALRMETRAPFHRALEIAESVGS